MFRLNRFLTCIVILLASAFWSAVFAQVIGQPYRVDDRQVERILKQIEQQSDKFRSGLDEALDKSRFNGSSREDDINAFVKDFYQATKNLRNRFNDHKSTSPDVETVLDRAARIDGFMRRYPLTSRAQDDWSSLRANLDELANVYNVSWRWGEGAVSVPVSDVPYRISDKEVERVIKRIEDQSDKFRSRLDSALDKSRLDGTRREDDINAFVKDFYRETKTLRDHFDHHKSTGADVQSVLERAARIDDFMRRNRIRRGADSEWAKLRVNLDELARIYNVSWRWLM
jgi:hypothetical protein